MCVPYVIYHGANMCGMTVQDRPHVGHMLAFTCGDMIRRYLEYKGYEVTYIQNFTDVDDKIIARANARQGSPRAAAAIMRQAVKTWPTGKTEHLALLARYNRQANNLPKTKTNPARVKPPDKTPPQKTL